MELRDVLRSQSFGYFVVTLKSNCQLVFKRLGSSLKYRLGVRYLVWGFFWGGF